MSSEASIANSRHLFKLNNNDEGVKNIHKYVTWAKGNIYKSTDGTSRYWAFKDGMPHKITTGTPNFSEIVGNYDSNDRSGIRLRSPRRSRSLSKRHGPRRSHARSKRHVIRRSHARSKRHGPRRSRARSMSRCK